MWERIATRLAVRLLKKSELSVENRSLLTATLLDKLGALPFTEIIENKGGQVFINGAPIEYERAKTLIESAKGALNNSAMKLVWEAVAFTAVKHGIHNAETEKQVFWARAALWWSQQEMNTLKELAGEPHE